jgi:D-aminoacyl-tRNA deacylase
MWTLAPNYIWNSLFFPAKLVERLNDVVVVASVGDTASLNMAHCLIETFKFKKTNKRYCKYPVFGKENIKVAFTDNDLVHEDQIDNYFNSPTYVFVSRHRSESEMPCLTCHFPGNFGIDISSGGRQKEIAYTHPSQFKNVVVMLWSARSEANEYQIVIETTHHGPTSLKKTVIFVEIGSSQRNWNDHHAASLIAGVLWKALRQKVESRKVGIGLGGPHYSGKFTRLLIESDFAIATTASKYVLPLVDRDMLYQMIQKSVEKVRYAFLDWKGLGPEKNRILTLLNETNLEVIRV